MKIENKFPAKSADTPVPFRTILLVDDSAANLGVLVESLESQGYDVLVALDGNEALERIEVSVPDLILLDVMMPDMDGFEVCRRLKAQDYTRDIPVIFMTSLSSSNDKVKGFAAGGVDYITKPLHVEETLARIRTHLELRELRRKLEAQNGALQQEVVERKRLDAILVGREQEFRTLAENAPDPIFRYDRDCRRVYVNPAVAKLTGVPLEKMLGKSPNEFVPVPTVDSDKAQRSIQRVLDTGKPDELEVSLVATDGREVTILNSLVPEFATDGSVESVLCIGRDISARKQMETILIQSEREYRTLSENSPDSIIRYDRDCRIRYVNKNFAAALGLPAAFILGKTSSEVFSDGLFDELESVLKQVVDSGQPTDYYITLPDSSEGERYHHLRITPERDEHGEVNGILAIGRDITERKNYENALLARVELEQRLSSYVNSAPGFFFSLRQTPEGQVSMPFASDGIKSIYGLPPEEVAESVAPLVALDHPDDVAKKFSAMEKSGRTLLPCQVEFRVLNKEKGEIWVEARSMPKRDEDGTMHWHGFMQDITERKRMEAEFAASEEKHRTVFESANDGIFLHRIVERDGNTEFVLHDLNQRGCELWGHSREDILTGNFDLLEMNNPPYSFDEATRRNRLAAAGKPQLFDWELKRGDGSKVWGEVSLRRIQIGGEAFLLSVMRDLNERKAIETALHDSEKMLQEAQRIAHVGSWDVDMVNDKLVWSDEIFRIWEIDKTKFKADFAAFIETVHPEDRERVSQAYNEAVINHTLYEVEHRLLFPDGRVKHILERGEPQYDAQGKPVRFIGTSLDITERKLMEEVLVAREQQFRALAENTPDLLYRYDCDCRRLYVNPAVIRLSGKQAEELLGNLPSDGILLVAEQYKKLMAKIRLVFDCGEIEHLDIAYTTRTGEHRDYQMMLVPERDDSGAVMTVLGIARDVTEIRSAERRLSQFVANVPGYVYTYKLNADYSGSYPFVSPGVADVLGLQPEEVVMDAAPMMALIHPDDITRLGELAGESMRTMQPYSFELRITHPTKGARWLESHASPELTAEGLIQWHGMTLDITERKLAQQQQELLDTAISHSSDAIYLIDKNGRFHYVNATACRSLDYSREELLGMSILDIDPFITQELLLEGVALLETVAKLPSMESLHRARDGREFPVEVSTSMVEHNGEQFMLSVVRDITERKLAEQYEQFRSNTLELLAGNNSLPGILKEIVRGVEQLNSKMLCSILLLDSAGKHLVDGIAPSLPDFYNAAINGLEIGMGVGSCGTAATTGERVIVEDIQTHPYWAPFKELAAQAGLGACWSQPIRSSSGKVLGTFAIYHRAAHSPTALDISLIEKVAHIASIAIERKRMEAELVAREQEFYALVEHAPEPIFRYAPDGRRIYVNAAVERLTGVPASVLLGEPSSDGKIVSAQSGAAVTALVLRIVATGEPGEMDVENVGADGCLRHFHNRIAPEFDADGKVRSVFSISHDITERKRMELALQARERDFSSLADNLPDNIARWNVEGCYLYVNPTHERLLGVAASEVIGKPLPATHEHVKAAIAQVVASGRAVELVRQTVQVNGELQIHEVSLVPELDAAGQVVSVLGLGRNMTEFYRMQDAIVAREREFRTLAENTPDPIYRYDRDCRRIYVNPAVAIITGKPLESFIGSTPADGAIIASEQSSRLMASIRTVFDSGETRAIMLDFVAQDGEHLDYHMLLIPECDANGQVATVLAMARNVTEMRRLERRQSQFFDVAPGFFYTSVRQANGQNAMPFASPGIRDLFGLEPADVMQSSELLLAQIHPDDYEQRFSQIEESARNLTRLHYECRIDHPQKGVRWIEANSLPQRLPDGSIRWDGFMQDITERKHLESELLGSRNFLNRIIDSIPDPIFVKDKEHRWLLSNEAFCNLIGQPREQLIGKSDYDFLPKDQADVFWEKDELVFNSGVTNVNEEVITGGSGETRYLHTKKTPFVSVDGRAMLVGVIRDISERKQVEFALRANEEKLSSLFTLSPLGIALTDMQGRYVEFNEAFRAICGYPADELMALDYWTLTPREYEAQETVQLELLAKTGRYGPYEKEYRQKDGVLIPIQLNGMLVTGKDGQQYIWSIVEDIRERKQGEAQLREKFERIIELNDQLEINARDLEDQAVEFEAQAVELEASQAQIKMTEAWYRGIVRSAPEGMVVVNDKGCISLVNAHLEKMFGYAEGELLGNSIEVLLPSDIRQGHVAQRDGFFAAGVTGRSTDAMAGSLRACRKDGSEFPVEVSLSRLPEIDGSRSSICASVRDITGRRAMESARETALAEALRLAQLRSAFMAQMSHELRTPLNGILGYAQNLLHGDALGEKQTAGLRIIQNSGEHLLSLINGVLDHAAIEADKFELIPGNIELESFLSTLIGIIRVRIEQKNLAFVFDADAGLPAVVRGDAQRLRQVLLNLLSNAVKFTDKGQVTLRVSYQTPSRLHFAVQDSGVGIDADQLETIFLPFEQAGETSRRAGGTGLGLAISRKLVRLMGGDIKVESQSGAGSTFSFEIEMEAVQSGMSKVNVTALSEQATTRVAQAIWLHAPSRQELDILHGSALRGNMRDVIKHADQLAGADSRYLPFAEQLRQLAQSFQTKALLSLISQYRNEKETEQ